MRFTERILLVTTFLGLFFFHASRTFFSFSIGEKKKKRWHMKKEQAY